MQKKIDVEQLLAQGKSIQIYPQGYSMYPLFVPGRDEAVISPLSDVGRSLRRGDVVLYRREGGILVLHRIYRVTPGGIYLVGDHQTEIEGPLQPEQMRGILTGVVRNGRYFPVKHPVYQLYSRVWLFLRPLRKHIERVAHALFRRKT